MRYWLISLGLTILLALAACSNETNAEPTPPVIHYGEDLCEACGMIISDARFAAAYITKNGESQAFDEIGGMMQTHLEKQADVVAFFVHDYDDQGWIRAETATFVLNSDIISPMSFGLIAFAEADRAAAFAQEMQGTVLTFEETMQHYQEQAGHEEMHEHQQ